MSAPVDVLEVLREAVREGRYERDRVDPRSSGEWQAEADQALAAVAELIAASERSLTWLSSYPGGNAMGAYDAMRAALARCQPDHLPSDIPTPQPIGEGE